MQTVTEKLDKFTRAYLECALWSSTNKDGDPLDTSHGITDIDADTLKKMVSHCQRFQSENAAILADLDPEQCGHDFWLTRNGHGAGFWDRGYEDDLGEKLTDVAHAWGEQNLYVGDDGKIYA